MIYSPEFLADIYRAGHALAWGFVWIVLGMFAVRVLVAVGAALMAPRRRV
jgi:hypothetical protein